MQKFLNRFEQDCNRRGQEDPICHQIEKKNVPAEGRAQVPRSAREHKPLILNSRAKPF